MPFDAAAALREIRSRNAGDVDPLHGCYTPLHEAENRKVLPVLAVDEVATSATRAEIPFVPGEESQFENGEPATSATFATRAEIDMYPPQPQGVEPEVDAEVGAGARLPLPSRLSSNVIVGPWERQPGDVEAYAEALRRHGPMSYGMAMGILGWGATRAGQAEQDLSKAGRISFNALGRAVLVDEEGKAP